MYIQLRNVNFVNLMKYELNVCVLYVTLDIYPISQARMKYWLYYLFKLQNNATISM